MDYAKLINEYRKKMCITQKEFADMLHVGFVTVSRWERGIFEPTLKMKKRIKKMLLKAGLMEE